MGWSHRSRSLELNSGENLSGGLGEKSARAMSNHLSNALRERVFQQSMCREAQKVKGMRVLSGVCCPSGPIRCPQFRGFRRRLRI